MSVEIENKKSDVVGENIFSAEEKISDIADHENKSEKISATCAHGDINSNVESPQIEINRFFNDLPIRILNSHEEPFFYLEDISKVLAIKHPRKTVANFEGREIVTLDQRQKYNIITYKIHRGKPVRDDRKILLTEPGVYRIIFTTKSQLSGVFRDWVYDVLRQLRLTGEYKINAELQQLRTVNETLLKENNHLKSFTDDLIKKQDKFKNLCEKLYLVEFPNNPLEIEQTNLPKSFIKKHSHKLKYNTIDNLYAYAYTIDKELKLNTPFIETSPDINLADLKIAHNKNTEIAKTVIDKYAPRFSYLITNKITPEILTAGTIRHSMWVRNSKESLTNIDKSLISYKSLRIKDKFNLYLCDKEKIINAMNVVIE